tara:strand:+ start:1793 stop:2779 length:987 start_codon:yes stop_codon:yes gene_type:complete
VNRYIKLIFGICISIAGLYYAFKGIDFIQLWKIINQLDLFYGALSLTILVSSNIVRALRWQILVYPIERFTLKSAFSSIMIGYFGNSVLPFRMGELLRAYVLAEKSSLNVPTAFGTIVTERILDFVGLSLLILLTILVYPADWISQKLIITVVVLSLAAFVFVFCFKEIKEFFLFDLKKIRFFHKPVLLKIIEIFERLINGAVAIRSTNNVMLIFFYTILIWLMYAFSTYYALLSTGIFIKWYEVCVLMISTTLAISVPAAPAYVGTYHATVVYVLTTFFLINQLEAQASAIIIHAVGTIPFIIIGAWYFINSSVSIREINAKELINN